MDALEIVRRATGPAIATDDGIAVVDAWGRPTPPNADEAAFYVTIRNEDAADTSVTGASFNRISLIAAVLLLLLPPAAAISRPDAPS